MPTPRVLRKVKIDQAWRMLPVAKRAGKLDLGKVVYNGKSVAVSAGSFYLEYYDPAKTRRSIGDDARAVASAVSTQAAVLGLRKKGVRADDAPQIEDRRAKSGKTIREVIAQLEKKPPAKLRGSSVKKYLAILRTFEQWTTKTHLSELAGDDILDFVSHWVHDKGLAVRTAVDKAWVVHSHFRKAGYTVKIDADDWPQAVAKNRTIYERETLKELLAAATFYEQVLFNTFYRSAMRDQEVGFLAWPDFDPRESTLAVTAKPELGFRPKNYHERVVPIPQLLVDLLLKYRRGLAKLRKPGEKEPYLMFATSAALAVRAGHTGGKRDTKMLDRLKRLALRAGVNCGRCRSTYEGKAVTCATAPVCRGFNLHKFRHTCATTLLRDGMDVRSLQEFLGHKDMESTMIYLKSLRPQGMLAKVNASSLGRAL